MIVNTIKGDIIDIMNRAIKEENFLLVAHGCNCQNIMGSGIAEQLARNFPHVLEADRKRHEIAQQYMVAKFGSDRNYKDTLLGDWSFAPIRGDVGIFNLYTQFMPGKDLSMDALEKCFSKLNKIHAVRQLVIPKIGAGVAGGDWEEIVEVINRVTPDINITVVEWNK